jgi:hypothetical protein
MLTITPNGVKLSIAPYEMRGIKIVGVNTTTPKGLNFLISKRKVLTIIR